MLIVREPVSDEAHADVWVMSEVMFYLLIKNIFKMTGLSQTNS